MNQMRLMVGRCCGGAFIPPWRRAFEDEFSDGAGGGAWLGREDEEDADVGRLLQAALEIDDASVCVSYDYFGRAGELEHQLFRIDHDVEAAMSGLAVERFGERFYVLEVGRVMDGGLIARQVGSWCVL